MTLPDRGADPLTMMRTLPAPHHHLQIRTTGQACLGSVRDCLAPVQACDSMLISGSGRRLQPQQLCKPCWQAQAGRGMLLEHYTLDTQP